MPESILKQGEKAITLYASTVFLATCSMTTYSGNSSSQFTSCSAQWNTGDSHLTNTEFVIRKGAKKREKTLNMKKSERERKTEMRATEPKQHDKKH